jgi:hypothetical protein
MKFLFSAIASLALIAPSARAQDAPELLSAFLKVDQPVSAQVVVVIPPPDIEKYISKVEQAAQKDPKWFLEQSKNTPPGVPLPYHEKIGLNQQEYDDYLALWAKREIKAVEEVNLMLRKSYDGRWNILASGSAAPISSLRFSAQDDNWKSTNGVMTRLDDVKNDEKSIFGAWSGKEWRFEEETSFSKIKENLSIGITADKKFYLLAYRGQEMSSTGSRLLDKSVVIRVSAPPAPAPSPATPSNKR